MTPQAGDRAPKGSWARLWGAVRRALEQRRLRRTDLQAEAALRHTAARFRSLVEHSADGVALLNPLGTIIYSSPSTTRIIGYTVEELVGKTIFDIMHPEDHAVVKTRLFGLLLRPGGNASAEFRIRCKDGGEVWVEGVGVNLLAEPNVHAIVCNFRDIMERKQAAEMAQRLAAIVESSDDAILSFALDASIQTWNPGAERIYGYAAGEVMGRSIDILVRPEERAERAEIYERVRQLGQPIHFEAVRVRKDGTPIRVSITLSPERDGAGKIVGLSGIGQDVTERRRAEEALWKAREAEQASEAKSEFLSRMSHELRTPLNAILGFAQLLEMDSLNPEQRESVTHILRGGRHLLQLINEVLDIARIESGRLSISLEPVPLGDVVQETVDLITPMTAETQVHLHADAAGLAGRHILADRQRIKQVLLNLLSNAVKYNHQGGTVTLTCAETPEGRLRIRVSDTGPGIPPDKMDRLFIPFDRLGAEQTGIQGTGLGLALSKRLVEAMGGTIGVTSTVGHGSTFWVEVPLTESPVERLREEKQAAVASAAPGTLETTHTVLYVEDNLSNLELIQRLLARHPEVKLIPAMQGRLGLDLAREHRPDLILLDLHLPDIQGDEVLRRLREAPETRQIPVVIISADAIPRQIDRLLAAGARAYLTKPLDVKKFFDTFTSILREGDPGPTPDR
jgi:PAS domain S-box-containing protein